MIIGYWSEKPGKGSTTYNMIASAIAMSMECDKNIIVAQAKCDYNKVDYAFVPYVNDGLIKEDYGYYNYSGMDALLNKLENDFKKENLIKNETVRVGDSNLFYIPSTRTSLIGRGGVFEQRFSGVISKFIDEMKELDEIVFVELSNGFEFVTGDILNNLDILVINISQDNKALENIRDNHLLIEKSCFIVGKYDDFSEFSVKDICRKYKIPEQRIGLIPYNVRFKDSFSNGKCKMYFDRNFNCEKGEEEYYFIKNARNVAKMLMLKEGTFE